MKLARAFGLLFIAFALYLFSSGSVFALSETSMDCDAVLREATRGAPGYHDWSFQGPEGGIAAFITSKKDIRAVDKDTCTLRKTWTVFGSIAQEEDVQITYFSNQNGASAAFSVLKSSEPTNFRFLRSTNISYGGFTYVPGVYKEIFEGKIGYEIPGPLFARAATTLGKCLIRATYQHNGDSVLVNEGEYEEVLSTPYRDHTAGFVDKLANHAALRSLCGAGSAPRASPTPQPPGTTPAPTLSRDAINDWIKDTFGDTPFSDITIEPPSVAPERPPEITDEKLEDIKLPQITIPSLWHLLPSLGDDEPVLVTLPGANEGTQQKEGKLPLGSTLSTGGQSMFVSPGKGGGMMHVAPDTKVTLPSDPAKSNPTVHQGTVEFKTDKPMEVNTEIVDIIVIGTHFWVSHDPIKKQTTVGIYEGKVEVKPKGGRNPVLLSPKNGTPGILIVSKKQPLTKFIFIGLLLIGTIVGVFLFAKMFRPKRGKRSF